MGEKFLIDTSAVIKYLNKTFPISAISFLSKEFDSEINISIVTKVEFLAWDSDNADDILFLKKFIDISSIHFIDDNIGDIAITIRKATNIKLPDVFIAATDISFNATLIADNDKDFHKIVSLNIGLKYLNPFTIK